MIASRHWLHSPSQRSGGTWGFTFVFSRKVSRPNMWRSSSERSCVTFKETSFSSGTGGTYTKVLFSQRCRRAIRGFKSSGFRVTHRSSTRWSKYGKISKDTTPTPYRGISRTFALVSMPTPVAHGDPKRNSVPLSYLQICRHRLGSYLHYLCEAQ